MGRARACNRVELSLASLQWLVDRQAKFYLAGDDNQPTRPSYENGIATFASLYA